MRKVQRYAFKVYYDGTRSFHGLQRQPGIRTVEGELIRALVKSHQVPSDLRAVNFAAAGRTDRFVSALGNAFAVNAEADLRPAIINSYLDESIRIWAKARVPASFNPRREALERHYKYFSHIATQIDWDLMTEISRKFLGEHDFRSFAHSPSEISSVRKILDISIDRLGEDFLSITIVGDSFLQRMARRIVGTLLAVASGYLGSADVERLLDPKNPLPKTGVPSASPEGLVLWDVQYSIPFEVDRYAVKKLQRTLVENLTALVAKKAMLEELVSLSRKL